MKIMDRESVILKKMIIMESIKENLKMIDCQWMKKSMKSASTDAMGIIKKGRQKLPALYY